MRENGMDSPYLFFIAALVLSLALDIPKKKKKKRKNALKGVSIPVDFCISIDMVIASKTSLSILHRECKYLSIRVLLHSLILWSKLRTNRDREGEKQQKMNKYLERKQYYKRKT